ncbi:MAG: LacI family transcriptional regulator [Treponema sp.]|nr:LacI family transcriptional regulator [Treponema sp.]
MITLKELSIKCGVSIATISNVINGKENVSEKTKKLVMDAVRETGYQPNILASSLRSTKSKTIGIIIEDVSAFSSPELIEGIMSYCEQAGYRAFLENLRLYAKEIFDAGTEFKAVVEQAVRQMLAIKVDGIVFLAAHSREVEVFPGNLEVPAVVAYAKSSLQDIPSVLINDEKAAYDLTKYILSKGYKKIGMVTGLADSVHTIRRVTGYKKAINEAGLVPDDSLVLEGDWMRKSGYEKAAELMAKNIDAVFCANDNMAAGFCDYLRDNNLVPGKDIGVAGFDGQNFTAYMNPPLTTMKLPLREIGKRAGELILSKLNASEEENEKEIIEIKEDCVFVQGQTI